MQKKSFEHIVFSRKKTFLACIAGIYGSYAGLLSPSAQAQPVQVNKGDTLVYDSAPFVASTTSSNSAAVSVAAGGSLVVEGVEVDISSDGNNSPALKISGNANNHSNLSIIGLPGQSSLRATNAGQVVEVTGGNASLHLENVAIHALGRSNQTAVSIRNGANTEAVLKNSTIESDGTAILYGSVSGSGRLLVEKTIIRTQAGRGIDSQYAPADIVLRNVDIQTGLGQNAPSSLEGVFASDSKRLTIEDSRIETFAQSSAAVKTFDPDPVGLEGSMTRVEVITHGFRSDAVEIMNAQSFLIEDSSVLSHGDSAHAVAAHNAGVAAWPAAHVFVKNSQIETTGSGSAGLYLSDTSTLDTEGVQVKTSGASALGVYMLSKAGFTLNTSTISTTGADAHGISKRYTAGSAPIGLNGSTIKVSGEGAWGVLVEATHTATQQFDNTLTLNQSTVTSEQGAAVRVRGGKQNTVTLSQSHLRAGADAVALQTDLHELQANTGLPGATRFVIDDRSSVQGDILANSGTLDVSLSNYSVLSGAARVGADDHVVTTMDIDRLSGWNMTGNSTVGALNNAGFIRFGAPTAGFKTLTVQGDMVSADNSLLVMYSQMGADDSPTDLLQINGDQVGNSYLTVLNRGGQGALTNRGIKVVDIAGEAKGRFTLTADYFHKGAPTVVGGAYAYKLYQGVSDDPDDKNWYLRSKAMPPPEEGGGGDGGGGGGGGEDGGGNEDDGPWLQEGAPLYEVYSQMLLNLQRLPTLAQRRGPGFRLQQSDADGVDAGSGLWVRTEGMQHRLKPRSSTAQADYRMKGMRLQIGADRVLSESAQGRWVGGLSGHYTYGKADVHSRHSPGQIKTDGFGVDGTMTWQGADQSYVDLQSRLVWHRSDLKADMSRQTVKEDSRAFGYALSVEAGKAYQSSPQWAWTPQAQLRYTNVRFKQFEDIYGASVRASKHASLQARLGMMVERRFAASSANAKDGGSVYGVLDLYYEFLNGTEIDLSGLRLTNRDDRLRGGVGLGGSYRWNKGKYVLYGEGNVSTSLKHFSGSNMYRAMVGLNIHW